MAAKETLKNVPTNMIHEAELALRTVDKSSEDFAGLVQSVKSVGILNPIVVREQRDNESGVVHYGLIDGLHRFTAAKEAGLEVIPVHIVNANDLEVLQNQIIGNIHRIETKPVQYSHQLKRLIGYDPTVSIPQLAARLGRSAQWLSERMNLTSLTTDIAKLVDTGEISVSNATHLAKLPNDEQPNFVDRAMTMSPSQFVPTVNARIKEIREANRQGRAPSGPKEFSPVPFLQKMGDVKAESENPQVGPALINSQGITTPLDAWNLAVKWFLHLDPISIEAGRAKFEEGEKAKADAKAKRDAEREAKKLAEAAETAVEVGA